MSFWDFFLAHPGWVIIPALALLWGLIELIVWITPSKEDDRAWKMTRSVIISLIKITASLKKKAGITKK